MQDEFLPPLDDSPANASLSDAEVQAQAALALSLTEAIEAWLRVGLDLPGEALAFLEAVQGEATPEALQALHDDDSATGHSVLALIFFPDLALRKRLEPLLGTGAPPAVMARVAECLRQDGVEAVIRFPDGRSLRMRPPGWALASLVARTGMGRVIPSSILERLTARLDGRQVVDYRILLRSSRFQWTEQATRFLETFLDRAMTPAGDAAFLRRLESALEFLGELRWNESTVHALAERRQFYHAALENARRHAALAGSLPMEVQSSRGLTPPTLREEDCLERIEALEYLARTVHGRLEPLSAPGLQVAYDPGMLSDE